MRRFYQMSEILTDNITFSTLKSLSEIANIIRNAAYKFGANVEKIGSNDPLAQFDNQRADMEIALSGEFRNLKYFEQRKFTRLNAAGDIWVVQIYVTDFGDKRGIEMVSLGTKPRMSQPGIHTKLSKSYRDQIADMLV